MTQTGTLKKLSLILLLVVLLPALFYSGYEINSISTTENLIGTIYRSQLDVILFSLNQYAWDIIANNWATTVHAILIEHGNAPPESLKNNFGQFLTKTSSLQAVCICDTSLSHPALYLNAAKSPRVSIDEKTIIQDLAKNSDKIQRLLSYQRMEYRKIEPIQITENGEGNVLALVFIVSELNGAQSVVTFILDEQKFIDEILSPKLQQAAGEEFVLGVFKNGSEKTLFSTDSIVPAQLKQTKQLWLFPDYMLGIALRGTSIEEITHSRFNRNLILIGLVDVILIIGVWVVYRSMRREVELIKLKSDFVSNVSHELRTPLSLIRMFTETLEMGRITKEEKKQEYYSTILQETERLTRLVNTILDFSRMESGRKQYQFTQVNLNDIVSDVLETYRGHLHSEGFNPILQLDESLPTFSADKDALKEAILNIVDNAVKYSNQEKYLRLATGRNQTRLFIEIEDHGMGIPPEHHKKIYENFYRVSDPLIHNVKGSGIGLAIVKHSIDAHGGTINLDSTPGKGSTFRIEFPLQKQS